MSDGAISQDEIEALLSGVDLGGGGGSSAGMMSSAPSMDTSVIKNVLGDTAGSFTSGIQTMTGSTFTIGTPMVEESSLDALLMKLPEMIVSVSADFTQGLAGDHIFVLPPDLAQSIASLVNKEENADLDDMSLSVVSELISQQVGNEITALGSKFPGLGSSPAQAVHIPKTTLNLKQSSIILLSYPVSTEGGVYTIWEIISQSIASEITNAFSSAPSIGSGLSADEMASLGSLGDMGSSMGMGGGMTIPGMNIPNVQSLQYPNLQQGMNSMEQGNISLIMDVYMEMTVELGRTKKQIKEILGMGEGTIIELDKLAGEPVDILVNHKPIAKGEVVVIDENFGVRVTEILSPVERVSDLH